MNFNIKNIRLRNTLESINKLFLSLESIIVNFVKSNYKFIIINVVFGLFIYYSLMSHDLVNDVDGLWHLSRYIAGEWELALGRWGLLIVDRFFIGVISIPLRTVISLVLISIANCIVLRILDIKNLLLKYVLSFIIIASPITCLLFTYSFTVVGYCLSYLLSCVAVYVINFFHTKWKYLLSGITISIMMSFYQTYINIVCVLVIYLTIKKILELYDIKKVLSFVLDSIICGLIGAFLYFIILKIITLGLNISLSDYANFNTISFSYIIKNLPNGIKTCYRIFINFFVSDSMMIHTRYTSFILKILFFITLLRICVIFIKLINKKFIMALLFLIMIFIIPLASNVVFLLVPFNYSNVLYSYSISYMSSLFILFFITIIFCNFSKFFSINFRVVSIFLLIILLISILKVENDQIALLEGRNSTINMAHNILIKLIDLGYDVKNKNIAIFGKPFYSELYKINSAMTWSNEFAKFGSGFGWTDDNGDRSWHSVFNYYLGIDLRTVSLYYYNSVLDSDLISNMPSFPDNDSIIEYGNNIIIKVSDNF